MFADIVDEGQTWLRYWIGQRMSRLLDKAVDELLGRERYERRAQVGYHIEGGECCRCHTHQSCRFSRNAGRLRRPLTTFGEVCVRWPRVKCDCGGSVGLNLTGWLEAHQRLDEGVDALVRRWAAMCMTLRDIQRELGHTYIGPLALRTLNLRLQQLRELTPEPGLTPAGPFVLQIDAIWFTQLVPNGERRRDHKQRLRAVKGRRKRCLLVALAVWPESERQEILGWQLADGEDAQAWTTFLADLEGQGLRSENGLTLVIHDGGDGLCKALQTVRLGAPQQRCLFHKLRNIAGAIQVPAGLRRQERTRLRTAILKDFRSIWQARDLSTALRRYLEVWRKYRHSQPEAAATLRRDFRPTLTCYALQRKYPSWPLCLLRTTSRLERFNRNLRRHIRTAGAFHSDESVLAIIAHEADHFFRPPQAPEHPTQV
jgi:hypothetical protein